MSELATSILIRLRDEVTSPLRDMMGAFEKFGETAHKAAAGFEMSAHMKLARDNIKEVADGIKEFTEQPKEMARDLETSFVMLQRSTGLTGSAFDDLKEKAKALGAGTKFDFTEIVGGLTQLTKRGISATDALQEIHPMELLAEAGQISLASAVDSTSLILKRYELNADQAAHVTDLIAAAARNGGGTIGQMGPALQSTAEHAHTLGLSLDTTAGMLAAFAKASGSTEEAGSALNTMLNHLTEKRAAVKIGEGMRAIFGAGLSSDSIKARLQDVPKLLEDVTKRTQEMGLSGLDTTKVFRAIFGSTEIAAMMKAMGPTGLSGLMEKMKDVKGEALEEAEAVGKTGAEAHEKMLASVKRLKEAIGEQLIPGAKNWDQILGGLADKTTAWVSAHPALIKDLMLTVNGVGKLAQGLAFVLPIFSAVAGAKGIVMLVNGLKTLTAASVAAAAPWAALSGMIMSAYWAYTKWKEVFSAAESLKKSQQESDDFGARLQLAKLKIKADALPPTGLVTPSGEAFAGKGEMEASRRSSAIARGAESPRAAKGQLAIKLSVDSEGRAAVTNVTESGDIGMTLDAGLAGLSP